MHPTEFVIFKTRCDELDNKISAQINDFIPEDIELNNKRYTKYLTSIFLKWLEDHVEDITFV